MQENLFLLQLSSSQVKLYVTYKLWLFSVAVHINLKWPGLFVIKEKIVLMKSFIPVQLTEYAVKQAIQVSIRALLRSNS